MKCTTTLLLYQFFLQTLMRRPKHNSPPLLSLNKEIDTTPTKLSRRKKPSLCLKNSFSNRLRLRWIVVRGLPVFIDTKSEVFLFIIWKNFSISFNLKLRHQALTSKKSTAKTFFYLEYLVNRKIKKVWPIFTVILASLSMN